MKRLITAISALAAGAGALALLSVQAADAAPTLPPANAQFDYQIGGAYQPLTSVGVVSRDRSSAPAAGKYNICYVNSFQTQPGGNAAEEGTAAWWKSRHANLLLRKASGGYVVDPGYPGEILFDTRTTTKRARIAAILGGWYDRCGSSGYRAIEPDNLDSWTRSKRLLSKANNVAMAKLLVVEAHEAGLAIAQKNTTEVLNSGIGFDFAIAEECNVYTECDDYIDRYGTRVYEIEYPDNGGRSNYRAACDDHGQISIIYRDRDVVPRGSGGYVYEWC